VGCRRLGNFRGFLHRLDRGLLGRFFNDRGFGGRLSLDRHFHGGFFNGCGLRSRLGGLRGIPRHGDILLGGLLRFVDGVLLLRSWGGRMLNGRLVGCGLLCGADRLGGLRGRLFGGDFFCSGRGNILSRRLRLLHIGRRNLGCWLLFNCLGVDWLGGLCGLFDGLFRDSFGGVIDGFDNLLCVDWSKNRVFSNGGLWLLNNLN
jgi:hypothetical protein